MLAVLLDPDKCTGELLQKILYQLQNAVPDFIFVGGSQASLSTNRLIAIIKQEINCEVVLFPGNVSQFSPNADAVLFLSLISGRNPEFLIEQHVQSALTIKQSGVEVIPTGYVLIDGGRITSVQSVSATQPISAENKEMIVSTAVAGELLGMKLIYLEAGSGALIPVSSETIATVIDNISVPLIVGGGIRTIEGIQTAFSAGADLVVVGNIFETEPEKIRGFINAAKINEAYS
ncbi:MAG: geranylgeranylglyceryl phosphate synthase [Bacteroidetes bacterium]|nr:geranylgeranylglyceryl phosphate synthase [Bacteroidota bacterium]